jgi:chorismate mutase/prephenate dehydratase
MRLHYLGPSGTFTEQAAQRLAKRIDQASELTAAPSIGAAFESLRADGSAAAVVPYYNYLEGLVQESLDGVFESGVSILAAERLPIRLAIARNRQSVGEAVVYSHAKGLSQCSDWLRERLPRSPLVALSSTAEAARRAAETPGALAIARREALLDAGLELFADDIGNRSHGRHNYTEFLLVGRCNVAAPPDAPVRTMVAVTPYEERVGLLADILNQFAYYRINLAKIHSRPGLVKIASPIDPQMFYFEVTGRSDTADFRACANAVNHRFGVPGEPPPMRLLGSYPLFDDAASDASQP